MRMIQELPRIVLKGNDLRKFLFLKHKYPVSQEFLHRNWANAKRFIIYALNPRCVLRTYAWRKRSHRVVIIRRVRLLLFDPRLKRMIKRRKANFKQWSSSMVRYYKKMGHVKEYEETELYGEELSKQMKQQLELLKSGKRGLSLIEDANKNVELRQEQSEENMQEDVEKKRAEPTHQQAEEKLEEQHIEDESAKLLAIIEGTLKRPEISKEKPARRPTAENESLEPAAVSPTSKANKRLEPSTEKASDSKFLDMLMNKVRVKTFARELNFSSSDNELQGPSDKPADEGTADFRFNDEASEDFVEFDDSAHQPGMLLTPLVPQSCKTLDGNGAFVSDALEAYMKKNNLRDTRSADRELLEPMYQDGRVTAHSVPPHMDMPAVPDSLQKLRTVAERRHYLQRSKNQKMAIINNEANIYRELQRKQRQRKVKIAAMQQLQSPITQMPFTRQGWQAASYVSTETDKYYYQVIRIDGEMVRLPGSQGNNARREKQPHRNALTAQELATLQCSDRCVDAALRNELKVIPTRQCQLKGKLQKLNQYPLPAVFRPCPLSQKPYQKPLDDDTAALLLAGGSMAVVSMPTVHLDVKPQLGRPLNEIAKRYLQYILPHHDITREWAEFSVSTLQESPNSMREAEAQAAVQSTNVGRRKSFTFVIPYMNDRNHILVRRVVDRSEKLDESFSASQPPERLRDLEFRKLLPENADDIALDCADMVNDMINTVAISCSENSFISVDVDAVRGPPLDVSPIKEESAGAGNSDAAEGDAQTKTGHKSTQATSKPRPNKQQRLAKELRRLNATIIDAAAIAKDANKPCSKDYCQLGCVCESVGGDLAPREHCGRAECVLECSCTGAELTRIMRVETDGRGLSNEDAFNLRRKATARLAKMEKDFTSTLVLTDNETLLINETQCDKKRRCTKAPKRYEDFDDSIEDDEGSLRPSKFAKRDINLKLARGSTESVPMSLSEPCSIKDTDFDQLKHCQVALRRLPDVANLATFCMTHQLYKCFCGGLAVEGKPVVIEKEKDDLPIPHYVPELATRAHYSFERPPDESNKKRRKEKAKTQPQKLPPLVLKLPQSQKQTSPVLKQPQLQKEQQQPLPQKQPNQQQQPLPQKQQQQSQKQKHQQQLPQKQVMPQKQQQTPPSKQASPPKQQQTAKQITPQKQLGKDGATIRLQPVKLLPKPAPVLKVEVPPVPAVVVVPQRPAELDIIFSYYRSRPNLCRRVVSVPRNCYLRLNRRRADRIRVEATRAETPKTQALLDQRVASAVSYYRSELEQQRRLAKSAQTAELMVIEVADDSDESEAESMASKRSAKEEVNVEEPEVKRRKLQTEETGAAEQTAKQTEPQEVQPQAQVPKLEIQMPKISACYSLNANALDVAVGSNEMPIAMAINEDSPSVDSVSFRASYNEVIKKMNTHVSKKMQDIDLALQRESKIIPAPNEEILCIIKWANFLAAFQSNYVFIWDVQMKNHSFLAATITNMMPAICGAIAVVNTHFAPDRNSLPLMARMLLEGKRNDNTSRLAVVMQGRQQYWLVKGFLRYMEGNACTKPTPQTHPVLTKKINVLCTLMVKQRIREQQRHQRPAPTALGAAASVVGTKAAPLAAASSKSVTAVPAPAPPPVAPAQSAPSAAPSTSRSVLGSPAVVVAPTPVPTSAWEGKASADRKEPSLICSNIEFRKVMQADIPDLQIPEPHTHDHRWLVLNLYDDFSHIFVPAFKDMISLDRIHNVARVAHDTNKMVKLQFFQDAPYDAFVTPSSKRVIYFGPLPLDTPPPVLVLLQSVDGKMMLREVYQRNHNIPVQRERRTMAFWLLQINGQVHFNIDLPAGVESSPALNTLEQAAVGAEAADTDDEDDCVIVINDDDEDKAVDEVAQPNATAQEAPTSAPLINFTIQALPQGDGGSGSSSLHITAAVPQTGAMVKEINSNLLAGAFMPFISNVPAVCGTVPVTQFLTPQVQLTQTSAPSPSAVASSELNAQPPPAKINRISVQRCTPTAATSAASAGKDPMAPKVNNTLQQLLSNNTNGNIKMGNSTAGLTITKMRTKDKAAPLPAAEPIKIGAKRKIQELPAGAAASSGMAKQTYASSSLPHLTRAPQPKSAVKTTQSTGLKTLAPKPPSAVEPQKHLLNAKEKNGFLVAKNLPRFRAKLVDSKLMVKLPDEGLYSFKTGHAASDYLNRYLSRELSLKGSLPGDWKFLPFENKSHSQKDPLAAPIVIED
ncbi:PREDICTED: uncharacterized protein LOC108616922 [Drosophila arizonae]|uniref:Uncharacterized protein LOC108616922 n=1 Tax=Drosophila arizonae TaxID=7263 RepID=A0ABM1PL51_DROAR|nr:PREDICTED: uncharacterized protein LOC108616922 [Drosophila arizonae]